MNHYLKRAVIVETPSEINTPVQSEQPKKVVNNCKKINIKIPKKQPIDEEAEHVFPEHKGNRSIEDINPDEYYDEDGEDDDLMSKLLR